MEEITMAKNDTNLSNNAVIDSERSTIITVGDKEYALLLTTKATKEIGKRYGGLQNLGDKLFEGKDNFEDGLDEILWLITLLANQSVLVHNYQFPNDKEELLDTEFLELMTSPYDLLGYKDAIFNCMNKGTKRLVLSEDTGANPQTPMTEAPSLGSNSTPVPSLDTAEKSIT
jgi:hypothetical protein